MMKRLLFAVCITLFFLLLVSYWTNQKEEEIATKKRKSVRFSSQVEIANAGGTKTDRYNPELRHWVAQNMASAMRAGGVKRLIMLDMLDMLEIQND